MKRVTLTLHEAVSAALRAAVDDPLEVAGVLIVGVSETPAEIRLTGRWFELADPATYAERSARHLRIGSDAYMPALAHAATAGGAALFVHSHPDTEPDMSTFDDVVDEELRSVFQIRTGSDLYGSLVVRVVRGDLSFTGRVWRGDEPIGSIELVREIGARFRFTSALDAPDPVPLPAEFDRQVRAFGGPIQELLSRLHVGVVGAGGTGSAVAEPLFRMGIGEVTIVDDQELEGTNVTRVLGSGLEDVGTLKVDVALASAQRIGLGTKVNTITRRVDRAVLDDLRACDIVFTCTDGGGRLDVARLAYWCLIPVFDLGVLLDSGSDRLTGIYERVDLQLPGTACVQCLGVVDQLREQAERLRPEDHAELQGLGYAPELDNPDPAVVVFTMRAAAEALSELIVRLTGIGDGAPSRLMTFVHDRRVQLTTDPSISGHWCSDPLTWGAGVTPRFLGRVWPP